MATTTTSTSSSASKSELKDLCIICEAQPYDLICTCGDKFDFNCIHQHIEQIGFEFQDQHQQVSEKLIQIKGLHENENRNFHATRTIIDNWKRKRIQDINDTADEALYEVQQRENVFTAVASFKETYDQLSAELHRVVHENLNKIIELNRAIQNKIEDIQNLPVINHNDGSLDASIQSKLHPSVLNTNISSSSDINNQNDLIIDQTEPSISLSTLPTLSNTDALTPIEPTIELSNTNETPVEGTNNDDFDAGQTRYIQRVDPVIIPANNDKHAGTICCHDNQLLYNNYDQTTQHFCLTFIRDITDPTTKQTIDWNEPDTTIDVTDDEWIQDIVYSNKLSGYLILNRARLRLYNDDTNELGEFHTFVDRTMKRLSCSDKYIYLTSTRSTATYNGDEIILMNYNKEEQLCKTFRDIIPSRFNRGAGPLAGEISDLVVGSNEQVTIGYRLERRHEVGVCIFNLINDGREWSCVKQLLLNDCWHADLSFTPRIEWCEKLNIYILIEYMTGHLIMINRDGQVDGECRFTQGDNPRESPINLTISTNDWLCVRYESSINVHKTTS